MCNLELTSFAALSCAVHTFQLTWSANFTGAWIGEALYTLLLTSGLYLSVCWSMEGLLGYHEDP